MASYDALLTAEQPWSARLAFSDAWFSDAFAIQSSFAGSSAGGDVLRPQFVDLVFSKPEVSPSASGGSENEASVSEQRRRIPPRCTISKRKPRPSKRASSTGTTTFIATDPADFRWMVQRMTGARFAGGEEAPPASAVLNLERRRELYLPESSVAFLLNGSGSALNGGAAEARRLAEPFCSFPTLESWKPT
ncbi:calmodulin-binding protein 25-like [Andrographis paniculata]|uniref:calmodulin-binding protein 25-like n=1 Tax=Andrographis paniculata TaxID=175694 RepID=UPI0021E94BD3|nr:calmodulin-binding protein 25-like [Andrographis paniculata]